jgi:predicted N-formylglutamate amidohydrolase
MAGDALLFTCEHGGNRIPGPYRPLFHGHGALLKTHRGFDAGALLLARTLAAAFEAPLVSSTVSRLLIDLNRSLGHPALFSPATGGAPAALRAAIVARHYLPYRRRVETLVGQAVADGRRVVHVSVHSFTPELDGKVRSADVGLLYDPRRESEAGFCAAWKQCLAQEAPQLRVRRNYPYAGKGDGLTSHLRDVFPDALYLGIEIEINQKIVHAGGRRWKSLRSVLSDTLRRVCAA